ncbi:beta-ketoacyl-[acyl-carrier-protein] synthase family protein [Clostridium felsineum]|uniref:Uncharacterized protein n=1 Tax=Clostridium felsineum TaxID=36839 RepID=A0A1S8KY14_9CLOT|nr:beta-ketoacyl-[acyl-carrier-protein] synthase family protein [Clostridium felsineum]URZ05468.1 hypothetical protein CLROS_007940 [Clostridium felsineum]URZ10508.1 hypothetical protein CROST_012180 [Clostridium felsineum]
MSKVVVTGVGILCSEGIGINEYWENICNGISGIKRCTKIDVEKLITTYAGEVDDSSFLDTLDKKLLDNTEMAGKFAMYAVNEAVQMSKLDLKAFDPYRVGCIVGTSLGGHLSGDIFHEQWIKEGFDKADVSLLRKYSLHYITDIICAMYSLRGPKNTISTACSASATAIGYAADLIKSGKADIMVAGGVDPISRLSFAGFNSLKALDNLPCSPYSRSNGITLGEGSGFLILENADSAERRGAIVLAELKSYGITSDAYHQTAPDIAGDGATRAMKNAIDKACLSYEEVTYINGHGTGTGANDNAETKAIKKVFGDHIKDLMVSSTKGATGHCLGAAGAIEAVTSVLSIRDNILPPTVNYDESENKFGMNFVANKKMEKECNVVISNSFAFGGNNSSLLFTKYNHKKQESTRASVKKRIVISGIGTIGCANTNYSELCEVLKEGKCMLEPIKDFDTSEYTSKYMGKCKSIEWKKYMQSSTVRRMDYVTLMSLTVAKQAIDDAKLKPTRANCERIGVMYGTGSGPISTIEQINRTIILQGMDKVNPKTFPNSVLNAAAGNICINYMLKGATSTIANGGASTSSSVAYAYELLCNGDADQMVVVGADECPEVILGGHDKLGLLARDKIKPLDKDGEGMLLSEGATGFVMETLESAKERGAHIYCEVLGYGHTGDTSEPTKVNREGTEWAHSFELALESADILPDKVDFVASAACGFPDVDVAETKAIESVFGANPSVSAVQSIVGHSMGCTGGFGLLGAIYALNNDEIFPTSGLKNPYSDKLHYVTDKVEKRNVQNAVVSSFSYGGNYVTLVVSKVKE